jgi:hypothetical protein
MELMYKDSSHDNFFFQFTFCLNKDFMHDDNDQI